MCRVIFVYAVELLSICENYYLYGLNLYGPVQSGLEARGFRWNSLRFVQLSPKSFGSGEADFGPCHRWVVIKSGPPAAHSAPFLAASSRLLVLIGAHKKTKINSDSILPWPSPWTKSNQNIFFRIPSEKNFSAPIPTFSSIKVFDLFRNFQPKTKNGAIFLRRFKKVASHRVFVDPIALRAHCN